MLPFIPISYPSSKPSSNPSDQSRPRTSSLPAIQTHQRILMPFNLSLVPMNGAQNVPLPGVARTYNFCQPPRDKRKRGAKPPPWKAVRSSTSPRPQDRVVRSCIYQQRDRHQGLQKMRHEWSQGPEVSLRLATACEGFDMWGYVLKEYRIVRCRYDSALMRSRLPKTGY